MGSVKASVGLLMVEQMVGVAKPLDCLAHIESSGVFIERALEFDECNVAELGVSTTSDLGYIDRADHGFGDFHSSGPALALEALDSERRPRMFHPYIVWGGINPAKGRHESGIAHFPIECQENHLDSAQTLDFTSCTHGALRDRYVQRVDHRYGVLNSVDEPSDDATTALIHHAAAVDLAFSRGVLSSVTEQGSFI